MRRLWSESGGKPRAGKGGELVSVSVVSGRKALMWKYMLAWIPMIAIAIANAALREKVLASRLDKLQAHQASTVTALILFGIYIWALTGLWKLQSARQAVMAGLAWLALTVAFEFLFGHFVMGHPWSGLFHDYNILKGRLWILVPAWITVAPYLFFRLRLRGGFLG